MREIKFRGKSKMPQEEMDDINIPHKNGWVFGNLIIDGGEAYIVSEVIECDSEYIALDWWVKVHTETVGQYTGLKDKNGKEIYKGDIVHCLEVSTNITREYVSEVFFEGGCWLVHESKVCDVELYLYDNSNPTKIPLTEIEVLGNIYENPELLEVK